MTATIIRASRAAPRCARRLARRRAMALDPDLAVPDHVLHLPARAVHRLPDAQVDAQAVLADDHPDAAGIAAAAQLQSLGLHAVHERLAVQPDGGPATRAFYVAVDARDGRIRRRRARLVGQARLAPLVERGALLRREEQALEVLRGRLAGRQEREQQRDERGARHDLAARSWMVMRSISQSARSRGARPAPVAARPVRDTEQFFTA